MYEGTLFINKPVSPSGEHACGHIVIGLYKGTLFINIQVSPSGEHARNFVKFLLYSMNYVMDLN